MIARVWRVGGVEHRNNKEGDEVRWGGIGSIRVAQY